MLALAMSLSGCGLVSPDQVDTSEYDGTQERDSVFGSGGIQIFGGDGDEADSPSSSIGVNGFLWRASLDTMRFMPLSQADPFGGLIITDWYQPPESPTERFKVNVYILSRELRSDGIRAAVFRQRLHPSGTWIDSPVQDGTATQLENSILTRARQLRVAGAVQ